MLHESAHIRYGGFWGVWDHQKVFDADEGITVKKDYWYVHGSMPWGTLVLLSGVFRHSMYQIQTEYLMDLAENYHPKNVPCSIPSRARSRANQILEDHIIGRSAWTIGRPVPLPC